MQAAIPLTAYLSLAASMALVGSYVGLSRWLVAVFPIFLLAWLRFAIAAVAMLPWLRRGPAERPISARDRKLLFWESFFGNFLFSICMLYGVAATSALAAGVVMAALPAMVALLSWLFLKERPERRIWLAIACAGLGIALLALARTPASDVAKGDTPRLWGYALLLAAVVCEASYVVIGKHLAAQVSPRRISALINLWGLALVTPLGLWQAASFNFATVGTGTWGLLLFYALAASMVTVWLWMRGLRHVPAPRAGVFTVMLPLAAATVGITVLGETASALHLVALVLAITGLVLATWPVAPPPAAARPGPQPASGHARARDDR
jgi:drug/metabolite transporter (DMT)-like permease